MLARQKIMKLRTRINILLGYTGSRYTSTREMKEKMEQCETVISMRNKKSEYERSMVCSGTES